MEIMIDSMMVAERREYLREDGLPGDKGNGFRMGHTYGQGRSLRETQFPYHFPMQ